MFAPHGIAVGCEKNICGCVLRRRIRRGRRRRSGHIFGPFKGFLALFFCGAWVLVEHRVSLATVL